MSKEKVDRTYPLTVGTQVNAGTPLGDSRLPLLTPEHPMQRNSPQHFPNDMSLYDPEDGNVNITDPRPA